MCIRDRIIDMAVRGTVDMHQRHGRVTHVHALSSTRLTYSLTYPRHQNTLNTMGCTCHPVHPAPGVGIGGTSERFATGHRAMPLSTRNTTTQTCGMLHLIGGTHHSSKNDHYIRNRLPHQQAGHDLQMQIVMQTPTTIGQVAVLVQPRTEISTCVVPFSRCNAATVNLLVLQCSLRTRSHALNLS